MRPFCLLRERNYSFEEDSVEDEVDGSVLGVEGLLSLLLSDSLGLEDREVCPEGERWSVE